MSELINRERARLMKNSESHVTNRMESLMRDPTPMTPPSEGDEYYDGHLEKEFRFKGGKWVEIQESEYDGIVPLKTAPEVTSKKRVANRRQERMEHVKRQVLGGFVVLVLTVAVNVAFTNFMISEAQKKQQVLTEKLVPPRQIEEEVSRVMWPEGKVEITYGHKRRALPPVGVRVDLGIADDGRVVWRSP